MCNKTYLFLFQFQASHSKRDCLVAAFTLLSPDHSKEEKKEKKKPSSSSTDHSFRELLFSVLQKKKKKIQ